MAANYGTAEPESFQNSGIESVSCKLKAGVNAGLLGNPQPRWRVAEV